MSLQKLPAPPNRVETGVVQFGDDWPGVFIRGDNAMHFALQLEHALDAAHRELRVANPMGLAVLEGLQDLLKSCDARIVDQEKR